MNDRNKRVSSVAFYVYVILITFLVTAILLPSIGTILQDYVYRHTQRHSLVSIRARIALSDLDNAREIYKMMERKYPPNKGLQRIKEHIQKTFRKPDSIEEELNKHGLRLEDLDERETLVFWLGGYSIEGGEKELHYPNRMRPGEFKSPLCDFDYYELTDFDNDGWLEYRIDDELVFVLEETRAAILHEPTGARFTSDFFSAGGKVIMVEN